ncbi:hypothetical protein X759_27695 [Mesorhizobium sp. LSHC420B00]|nr:hypothetical protein X759_27695 [Mesorhizobium sp. LSHC420B00]
MAAMPIHLDRAARTPLATQIYRAVLPAGLAAGLYFTGIVNRGNIGVIAAIRKLAAR